MTSFEIKKTALKYLRMLKKDEMPSTANLSKALKIPPRPLRFALKEMHEHGVIVYDRAAHGWKLSG